MRLNIDAFLKVKNNPHIQYKKHFCMFFTKKKNTYINKKK